MCTYLSWYANWWLSHADIGHMKQYDLLLCEGFMAYVEQQAHLRMYMQDLFKGLWKDVDAWMTGEKMLDNDSRHTSDEDNDGNYS